MLGPKQERERLKSLRVMVQGKVALEKELEEVLDILFCGKIAHFLLVSAIAIRYPTS